MTRQEANRQIVDTIQDMVELYLDMRFHQLLQNMGVEQPVIDQWYEESDETLCSMKKGMKL